MRKLFLAIMVILFISGCGVRNVPHNMYLPKITEKIYRGEADPILRIKSCVSFGNSIISSNGTAFVTTYKGERVIVTAYHVAGDSTYHRFYTKDRKFVKVDIAKVLHFPSIDTTIFYPLYISAKITPLEFNKVTLGEKCKTIGFPDNSERTEFKGKIGTSILSSSANVERGMSGGPVLNEAGKVIGIISAKVISASDGTKSYLIRLSDVFDVMDKIEIPK